MLKMNVIVSIEEPTDWVNSMVVIKKPNGTKNGRSKKFIKLDASNAYWQIPIDESSLKLTFNFPTERYRFLCIFYRIHSANNMAQPWIAQITQNIEGVENSQENIIIWGENSNKLQ